MLKVPEKPKLIRSTNNPMDIIDKDGHNEDFSIYFKILGNNIPTPIKKENKKKEEYPMASTTCS